MTFRGPVFTIRQPWWVPPGPSRFEFPNLVLQAAAQLRVSPVGETLDETLPIRLTRSRDYPLPNIALLNTAQLAVAPVGETLAGFDRPAPHARPQDFTFPNIALAPVVTYSPSVAVWGPAPPAAVRAADAPLPNLAIRTTAAVQAPLVNSLFERKSVTARPTDFPLVNIPVLNAAQLQVPPVGETLDETVPAKLVRSRDFAFANVALTAAAQLRVMPVGEAVGFDRPAPVVVRQDGPAANLLTTTFAVVGAKPAVQLLYSDRPLPRQPPQDFAFPNIALAPTTFVFRSPLIAWPAPVVRGVEALPPNLAIRAAAAVQAPLFSPIFERAQPKTLPRDIGPPNIPALNAAQLTVKPVGQAGVFDRPVRVAVPRDGPIPNLLTTTLSVVVPKPFSVPLFLSSDRPRPQQRVQDPPLPNILITVLQTVQLNPVKQIVFTERPAKAFIRWDTIFPNLVVHTKGRFPSEITDTKEYLQLPVNAVMAGNQPLKVGKTVIEVNDPNVRTKTTIETGGRERLSEKPSTFTVKTTKKGYD